MTTLTQQVREAARVAAEMCIHEDFDAMSWLDLMLEEDPQSFDSFFDTTWDNLSEKEQKERTNAIRKVL